MQHRGGSPAGPLTHARSNHWAAVPFEVLNVTMFQFRSRTQGEAGQCCLGVPLPIPQTGIVSFEGAVLALEACQALPWVSGFATLSLGLSACKQARD